MIQLHVYLCRSWQQERYREPKFPKAYMTEGHGILSLSPLKALIEFTTWHIVMGKQTYTCIKNILHDNGFCLIPEHI